MARCALCSALTPRSRFIKSTISTASSSTSVIVEDMSLLHVGGSGLASYFAYIVVGDVIMTSIMGGLNHPNKLET